MQVHHHWGEGKIRRCWSVENNTGVSKRWNIESFSGYHNAFIYSLIGVSHWYPPSIHRTNKSEKSEVLEKIIFKTYKN